MTLWNLVSTTRTRGTSSIGLELELELELSTWKDHSSLPDLSSWIIQMTIVNMIIPCKTLQWLGVEKPSKLRDSWEHVLKGELSWHDACQDLRIICPILIWMMIVPLISIKDNWEEVIWVLRIIWRIRIIIEPLRIEMMWIYTVYNIYTII